MITIRINNLDYNVQLVEPDNGNLLVDDTWRCGSCCGAGGKIYIDNALSDEVTRRTLIHELTHAYIYAYGHAKRGEYQDEDVCEFVSAFGSAIIYDAEAAMKHYGKVAKAVSGGNITTGQISADMINFNSNVKIPTDTGEIATIRSTNIAERHAKTGECIQIVSTDPRRHADYKGSKYVGRSFKVISDNPVDEYYKYADSVTVRMEYDIKNFFDSEYIVIDNIQQLTEV